VLPGQFNALHMSQKATASVKWIMIRCADVIIKPIAMLVEQNVPGLLSIHPVHVIKA